MSRFSLVFALALTVSAAGAQPTAPSPFVAGKPLGTVNDGVVTPISRNVRVYGGMVNKKIVASLQSLGTNAIGLTGADANLIPAAKRPITKEGIDFGFVGDVNSRQLAVESWQVLLQNNLTPVVAPLTHDSNGQMLNTNADTIASSVAVALSKLYNVRLIYCFEKKGVLENVNDENSAITLITKDIYKELKDGNKLFDGILPKIDNAFTAIDSGVAEVLIGHADDLLQNITKTTTGTLIK